MNPGSSGLAWFNGCEAVLWMVLAAAIAVRFRTAERRTRRCAWSASALLVAFGISDVIEIQTGAWWRPPELLILKALCLAGLAGLTPKVLGGLKSQRIKHFENASKEGKPADDADQRG